MNRAAKKHPALSILSPDTPVVTQSDLQARSVVLGKNQTNKAKVNPKNPHLIEDDAEQAVDLALSEHRLAFHAAPL